MASETPGIIFAADKLPPICFGWEEKESPGQTGCTSVHEFGPRHCNEGPQRARFYGGTACSPSMKKPSF